MSKFLNLAALALLAALLTGCVSPPSWLRPAQQFQVTLYTAGQQSSYTDAQQGTADAQNYALQIADKVEDDHFGVQDFGFVIEPRGSRSNDSNSSAAAAAKVKVTLSSGGKVVRTWHAEKVAEEYGKAFVHMPGATYYTIVSGDYKIETLP